MDQHDHAIKYWSFACFLLSGSALLTLGPLLFLAFMMVSWFLRAAPGDPDQPNVYVVVWSVAATAVGIVNLLLGGRLILDPRIGPIKAMALTAGIISVSCPMIWR
jgi:hypothetical protein